MEQNKRIKIGIIGSTGRMGKMLHSVIMTESSKYEIAATFCRQSSHDLTSVFNTSDVVVDFSAPELVERVLRSALECSKITPLVLCSIS